MSGEQEKLLLLTGDLLVIVADPIDRNPVAEVLRAALNDTHGGEDAEHVKRREDGEANTSKVVPVCDACPTKPSATRTLETERM